MHVELPLLKAPSTKSAIDLIAAVEGRAPLPNQSARERSRSPRRPKPPKQPAAGKIGEQCTNWNRRQGKCAGTRPCATGREHICDVCDGPHRSGDRPACGGGWQQQSGDKGKGKNKGKAKGKVYGKGKW